jgi:hypothetical protein
MKAPPLQTVLNELFMFSTNKSIKHFPHFLKLISRRFSHFCLLYAADFMSYRTMKSNNFAEGFCGKMFCVMDNNDKVTVRFCRDNFITF